jgi:regulator of protease activity HflC (stomatin/prohibitin superfamily)
VDNTSVVTIAVVLFVLLVLWVVIRSFVKLTQEYERGVVFRLGRVTTAPRGPGLIILVPGMERLQRVDLRTVTLAIQPQDCITSDNVTVRLDAVAYFKVSDPIKAIVKVRDYMQATLQIAQTSLRSVIGQVELDQLLSHRDAVNSRLREIIDKQTLSWGIDVSVVEIRDVQLPESMQRAMAKQAEAEREKRAKLILADAEFQAADKLAQAAEVISREPAALQLRYLQTLMQISEEKTTIILYDTSNLNLALSRLTTAVGLNSLSGPQLIDLVSNVVAGNVGNGAQLAEAKHPAPGALNAGTAPTQTVKPLA